MTTIATMQEQLFEQLTTARKPSDLHQLLYIFISSNHDVFSFPILNKDNKRVIVWTALFQHLQRKKCSYIYTHIVTTLRILSRDKTDIEDMICERWVVLLIERSGLLNFETVAEDSLVPLNAQTLDTAEEALKCLCNITFHSEKARAYCANTLIVEGLIARMQHYNNMPLREGCMLYDMKLLFILTALRQDIKTKVKELDGMEHLTDLLYKMLTDTVLRPRVNVDTRKYESINDQYQAISCEVLKVQFNLIQQTSSEGPSDEKEEAMFLKLMPVLTGMLQASASSHEKLLELHSNVANLLTSVPLVFYQYLTPELKQDYCCNQSFDGKNMDALQALLALLRHRLQISMDNHNQYENLSPILTVLIKSASACRSQRRYMRRVVLPPLRDVSRRPERGNTLRNLLCRLLTTPVTTVRDLVAEYLFILCKEKVGRMVKYTGFGNAAGHLAQKGLLAGGRGGQYSSSSDDSDTEEYRLAEPNIDPVVGCTRPPRVNPFDGMSEEQKEYEAMRLVDMFDRMMRRGVVKPARIADDGRLEALQHVVQMLPGAVPGKEKPKSRSYYDDSD